MRKKLDAGQAGTLRYQRQFGDALVCVRYRHHPENGKRYTTVEIVVDERQTFAVAHATPMQADTLIAVHIDYAETELRARAKEAGARWDGGRKAWLMTYMEAKRLGLLGRIKGAVE
ncbi:MAG: hypothetical protein AB1831_14650 [Pseudomonadota bacterium]